MKICKNILAALLLSGVVSTSHAALINGSVLSVDEGSFFSIELSPGFWVDTQITGHDGLVTGRSQWADGSHGGVPDGTENPGITETWTFMGNTGMNLTASPVNILNDDGQGQVELDFSGWSWVWNGDDTMYTYELPESSFNTVANISCNNDCSVGDLYTLTFSAQYPLWWLDIGNVGTHAYELHLQGTISAVPVPAAIWLFISGFIGLLATSGTNAWRQAMG